MSDLHEGLGRLAEAIVVTFRDLHVTIREGDTLRSPSLPEMQGRYETLGRLVAELATALVKVNG